MAWGPITPAQIALDADGLPHAPAFGDVYHARAGALAQARHVFLAGNGLPARWRGRERFVVLETGFGLGHNFLATWAAWQADPARPRQLHFVSVEKHPPTRDDLARVLAVHDADPAVAPLVRALLAAWPPATPDLHPIDLELPPAEPGGEGAPAARVRLLLGLGDIAQVLPELVARVDAFFLDGFAPARNPAMWDTRLLQGLNRLAAPDATAATWSVAGPVREALRRAGFAMAKAPGFGGKREMTQARFAPAHVPPAPPGRRGQPGVRDVVVIGAGLAGAAAARALAAQGVSVQVLEAEAAPAQATSGNPGGLLHGIVHAQDGPHARWLRAAALHAQRVLGPLVADGRVPGALGGLLRGESALDAAGMQAMLDRLGLPPGYVQVVTGQDQGLPWRQQQDFDAGSPSPSPSPSASEARSGADSPAGAKGPFWRYPGAGWISPAALVVAWLQAPGITLRTSSPAKALQRHGDRWQVLDAGGHPLAEADAVVLANAHDALRLLAALGLPAWPTGRQRGQTTVLPAALPGTPALPEPMAAGGYALRLTDGRLLCGATSQPGDDDPAVRPADHADNLAKLARLTGWAAPLAADDPRLGGRVGWRLVTDDRLPLVGPVPVPHPQGPRLEQPRQVPRIPGLWLLTALGSRGLTQAALAGELLAAWLTEAPWPVPASLVDTVDPARFVARGARRARSQA